MTKLKNGLRAAGCRNCEYYKNNKCTKDNEQYYELGAHFICDDFKQLQFVQIGSRYNMYDKFFRVKR
jgi:hypothetical protein